MDACFTNRDEPVRVADNDVAVGDMMDDETHQLVIELGSKVDKLSQAVADAPKPSSAPKAQAQAAAEPAKPTPWPLIAGMLGVVVVLLAVTLGFVVSNNAAIGDVDADCTSAAGASTTVTEESFTSAEPTLFNSNTYENYCHGTGPGWANIPCADAIAQAIEQAGGNVTKGYVGTIDNSATPPIMTHYYQTGLCPVNVHWHLGTEHLSEGQYDAHGDGPVDDWAHDDHGHRELASGSVRIGHQCHYYDDTDSKYTAAYEWEHCVDMTVGQTYEVHWPHSTVGACGTPYQYQTPFYDGVFCNFPAGGASTHDNVGVQAQVFTIVNDESYYYPDLIKGAIVAGGFWDDVAYYTGSTTGTSRDNDVCSPYSPITWQVDRKCHLISASSFDKMCADMKAQVDDMTDDLYPHGSRKVVSDELASGLGGTRA